jgi:cytochrome P450
MIAHRRAEGAGGADLLSHLLRASDEGTGMTDVQVRDEAITLFLAGHETTSNALTWTWYLLSQHADAEAALHAELDAVLGRRAPTATDVPSLPVTRAVLSKRCGCIRPPGPWGAGRSRITRSTGTSSRRVGHRGLAVVAAPRRAVVDGAGSVPLGSLDR